MDVDRFFKNSFLAMFVAICISVLLQSIFLLNIYNNPNLFFDGNFVPLWTHDAGLYGFYAKQILSGISYPFNAEYMPGWLLYGLVKITPFSLDQIIFFAPVFISSLVIVPIYGMFKLFNLKIVGFFAGILTTITYGYYYRSYFGYFDTDILNLYFPLLVIWGLMGFLVNKNRFFLLLSAFSMIGYSLWYHSFIAIGASIVLMWTLYTLVFKRDHLANYLAIFMLTIPLINGNIWITIVAILALFSLNFQTYFQQSKYLPFIFISLVAMGGFFIKIDKIYHRALEYIDKTQYIKSSNLFFLNTLNTVSEAVSINVTKFTQLVSVSPAYALIGLLGFIILVFRYKQFLLLLPLGALGFLSLYAGERFALYGVVIFSFGIVYIILRVSSLIPKFGHVVFLLFMGVVGYFYLSKIVHFSKMQKPIFYKTQLEVLSKLPKNKNNFILTWWDYGWPLWYTTEAKTLIDNGKHFEDNYIISKLLFSQNQTYVANASKQSVKLFLKARSKGNYKLIPYLLKDKTEKQILTLLSKPIKSPVPIYWYLHKKFLWLGNSIEAFSAVDLKSGERKNPSFLIHFKNSKKDVSYDKNSGILTLYGKKIFTNSYVNLQTKESKIYQKSNLHFIQMKDSYVVCNTKLYKSFLMQALVFRKVDTNLFKIVSEDESSILIKVR